MELLLFKIAQEIQTMLHTFSFLWACQSFFGIYHQQSLLANVGNNSDGRREFP